MILCSCSGAGGHSTQLSSSEGGKSEPGEKIVLKGKVERRSKEYLYLATCCPAKGAGGKAPATSKTGFLWEDQVIKSDLGFLRA